MKEPGKLLGSFEFRTVDSDGVGVVASRLTRFNSLIMTNPSSTNSLTISAGRVVCPKSRIDGPGRVSVRDGRITSVVVETADRNRPRLDDSHVVDLDFPDGILLPGLIDLHAHPAKSGSVFGADPDTTMLARGTTTAMSQGDAGADNIDEFLASTVYPSKTSVLLALNLSRIGESTIAGCFENLADADVEACVAAASEHPDLVRMISVNTSHHACGNTDPREILRRGLNASHQTGLPLLYGMRRPEDWPFQEQLKLLRAGDVVTYCFRREPHCIIEDGQTLPCVVDAKERGIRFDVGHGTGSFSFDVAEAAIANGFLPNTISTDLQSRHTNASPTHDLPLVMSKLAAAGMNEADIFEAVTIAPASQLGLKDAGSLSVGSTADLVVLERSARVALTDCHGICRTASRFIPRCVLRDGLHSAESG